MVIEKYTISLTLHHLGGTYRVQTNCGEYHSLMTLIADHLAIPGFGLCCGMGSCGTCRITIRDPHSGTGVNVLSCEVQINDSFANMDIVIPDKIY